MDRGMASERSIWSYRLCELPKESESISLEEALQERTGSCWEDARRLERFIHLTGLSQSECAKRLHRSQSSVANRLRLLKLPEDVRRRMEEAGLSERHARALLRLGDREKQLRALDAVLRCSLNVAQTESCVEEMLKAPGRESGTAPESLRAVLAFLDGMEKDGALSFALAESALEYRLIIHCKKV